MPTKLGSLSVLCLSVALAAVGLLAHATASRRTPTLMFTGDILLAGKPGETIAKYGPAAPFAKVAPLLRGADLAVGNLECSLSSRGRPMRDKAFTFRGRPEAAEALREAGFDAVSLANNHAADYGGEALLDTMQACRECEVRPVGAGRGSAAARRPAFVRLRRPPLTIAILAFSNMLPKECYASATRPGTNPAYPERIKRDIAAARPKADIVIVLFHWGEERADTPSRNQRRLAHVAAEAGADLVVGHHPHVLQGLEMRGDCVIAYSLGNFLFPSRRASTRQTMILAYMPEARGKATVRVTPCLIEGFKPRPATEKERRRLLSRMQQLCARLGSELSKDGRLVLDTASTN